MITRWPNHALQRTATGRHVGCLGSRRAVPPPSLSFGAFGNMPRAFFNELH